MQMKMKNIQKYLNKEINYFIILGIILIIFIIRKKNFSILESFLKISFIENLIPPLQLKYFFIQTFGE